ncbi:MAG: hypothetical protein OQJ97_08110 [Rhodospirillales bacterium]|nr:hypothetical protein [Rhodospirillales bacterium]
MKTVEVITDGGASYGMGHVRRSATLAWTLKRKGYFARVRCISDIDISALPKMPCDEGKADGMIIDLPYEGDRWLTEAIESGIKVLALDYRGIATPDAMIAIVDRGNTPDCPCRLFGLDYAIIRDDVRKLSPSDQGEGVVVSIGGGDLLGLGEEIAATLSLQQNNQVTLIEGPLVKSTSVNDSGYIKLRNPDDLALRIAGCNWAVTNGGATMMEMMCLGKAVHVVPQTKQEEELANIVLSKGGLLGVGSESLRSPELNEIQSVSMTARRLVDGLGTDRIANVLAGLL